MSKNTKTNSTTKGFLKIVMPITIQYLMSSMVGASDAFMLGFLDQSSLSAVSLGAQVGFVYSLFVSGFTTGLNVLAAQYWGRKDENSVSKVLAYTLRYSLIVGLIISIGSLIFPEFIMSFFTNDPELITIGAKYLRVASVSHVLTGFSQSYLGCMKICDRAFTSSVIGSVAVVMNILLNAVFIFGLAGAPKLGVSGAALATDLARVFEVTGVVIILLMKKCPRARIKNLFTNDKLLHSDYWKYTVPVLINSLGWGGGVTMYSVIMGHLGSDVVAANSIAAIVRNIICSFCWGVAAGVGIIIGNMLGAGELERAKKMGGKYVRLSLLVGGISGLVILAMSPFIPMVVTSLTPTAAKYLRIMLAFSSYYIVGGALNSTIISGIFPAGGDTKFGMICDVITLWVVCVPIGALAAFVFKWPVIVVAFLLTLDEIVKLPAVYIHYMKYKWVRNITRDEVSN